MTNLRDEIVRLDVSEGADKVRLVDELQSLAESAGYTVAERNDSKPWGVYLRLANSDAERFIAELFAGTAVASERPTGELSPKFLIVSPRARLSWQYHDRRAEHWVFLTPGAYHKSPSDDEGDKLSASAGEAVSFAQGERHRLIGAESDYTIVAEIWQHTDSVSPSDEADITRVQDDYSR